MSIYLIAITTMILFNNCSSGGENEEYTIPLNSDWQLFSSALNDAEGALISAIGFAPVSAYAVDIPSTVMSGLIQNGLYPDIYFAGRLEQVDRELFAVPWWYRKSFMLDTTNGDNYELVFEGINYKANIWLNGHLIAGKDLIEGPFGIWHIDVSAYTRPGENVLAVEVFRPDWGDLTIGFVDWSPEAPDRNMGMWRGVILRKTGAVSILHPFVSTSVNTETLDEAELTISATLVNHTSLSQSVTVRAEFDNRHISQRFTLLPFEAREVIFEPDQFKQLIIKSPNLWWPANLGEPHLYGLEISALVSRKVSDVSSFRFGIRQIEDYRNEDDHLGFLVNGKKVLIKGGGWVDDMLLADTDEKVRAQVDYVRHMNLNTIRLEGFWGRNKTLYDRCDELGIMLMIGWSCQWEWEYYSGRPEDNFLVIRDPDEQKHQAKAYTDQVLWLRNHPSVFLWNFGSDKLPRPELEVLLHEYLAKADTTRPLLSHCGNRVSEITGTSGVKMLGPYDWVSPNYWYIDKKFGGAYGFNTETGPGPQIPTLESIRRMIPEDQLWPRDTLWNYHSGRFEFNKLDRFLKAFNTRYGEPDNLEEFIFKNQMSNYEAIRPMFEAFAVNKYQSTGVIQWMLNSAWPKIIWQLYDYYLVPNAAFYGTKKACSPLVPVYNYGNNQVYVHNEFLQGFDQLKLRARIYDIESRQVFDKEVQFDIDENCAVKVLDLPEISGLTETYFLDLRLYDAKGKEVQNNFYWLSTKEDTHDWDATYWVYTPGIQFADLTGINNLPGAQVEMDYQIEKEGDRIFVRANLKNQSDVIAFFTELRLVDSQNGMTIVPVFWDDNYVSLLPGETRILTARISAENAELNKLELKATGWNVVVSGS